MTTLGVIEDASTETAGTPRRRWEGIALLGILALATVSYAWALGDRQLQPYYAAAVRSMTEGGRSWLFGGFDPAGVVTIDKTPFAFWVQGIGVWAFGYHWWAIALVQAAEGVATVFVLHRTVRRWAGERPALLAALILAGTPIITAIDRENQADALMVLLLVIAAYCVTRAVERATDVGSGTAWLVWSGVFIGLGFFAKMLAAWVVLPAFAAAFLVAPIGWPARLVRLLVAGLACAAVSLAWIAFIGLWPATDRPFVGSTTDDSIWQLVFGYNGFGRVTGSGGGALANLGSGLGVSNGGATGPLRLFGPELAGQIGWLLPVALGAAVGALVVWIRTRAGSPRQRAGWLLWGGWLVVGGLVLSFAGGLFHRYYTVVLAPAIAALVAAGLAACWGWYRTGRHAGLLLPVAALGTVGYAFAILDKTPVWQPWLRVAVVVVGGVCGVTLLVVFPGWRSSGGGVVRPVAAACVVAMLAGPIAFSVDTVATAQSIETAADPAAGPSTSDVRAVAGHLLGGRAAALYVGFIDGSATFTQGQREVADYVTAHAPGARVQLGVELGSWGADPYLFNSTVRVAPFGGYAGIDPSPTPTQLADWTRTGRLGYILIPGPLLELSKLVQTSTGGKRPSTPVINADALAARMSWLSRNCTPVPPSTIGPAASDAGLLFACRR